MTDLIRAIAEVKWARADWAGDIHGALSLHAKETICRAVASGDLIPLADHRWAVAAMVEKAVGLLDATAERHSQAVCDNTADGNRDAARLANYAQGVVEGASKDILALADTDALAEVQALRASLKQMGEMWEANQELLAQSKEVGLAFDEVQALRAANEQLQVMAAEEQRARKAAEAELAATQAKLARVVDAIGIVAEEATSAEIPGGFMPQEAPDWHRGYDAAIHKARAALEGAKP